MNRPAGGNNGGDVARGAGSAAVKGALLIGVAVVIGILLLQQVDSGTSTANSSSTSTTKAKPKTTTTVKSTEATSTTTTVAAAAPKTPQQLRVIVLNAGSPAGTASTMSKQLKTQNYTNQATANDWKGHTQTGNAVMCRAGL